MSSFFLFFFDFFLEEPFPNCGSGCLIWGVVVSDGLFPVRFLVWFILSAISWILIFFNFRGLKVSSRSPTLTEDISLSDISKLENLYLASSEEVYEWYKRLSYTELFDIDNNPNNFYWKENELYQKIKKYLLNPLKNDFRYLKKFDWSNISDKYDSLFDKLKLNKS